MSQNSVTVVTSGVALVRENNCLSGFQVVERAYDFEDALDFGKFLGPKNISSRVDTKERDLEIPREARNTWSIVKVNGASESLYEEWATKFADSDIGMKELGKEEVLLYWLQRTQDKRIVEILR